MRRLRLTTAGESHGPGLTALLTGLPAGLRVDSDFLATELARRQHGFGRGRRMQIERDHAEVRGGVRGGETLGSPVVMWIENRDFANWQAVMGPAAGALDPHKVELRRLKAPRPGHADLAGGIKYDRRDLRDILERASARESAARVAAGALAKLLLAGIRGRDPQRRPLPRVDRRRPAGADLGGAPAGRRDLAAARHRPPPRARDGPLVEQAKDAGDTLGGAVTVIARGVPVGLGSHVQWDEKLDGRLAQAVMSVPAVKAVEIGAGIDASRGLGSAAHDAIAPPLEPPLEPRWPRPTNRAGGLEGGITNGQDLVITAYKKPIATLRKGLPSVDLDTLEPHASQYERSDVTALPAAGVIAEAMVALVLADALLEKLGGDSMAELRAHWQATQGLQRQWPGGVARS